MITEKVINYNRFDLLHFYVYNTLPHFISNLDTKF